MRAPSSNPEVGETQEHHLSSTTQLWGLSYATVAGEIRGGSTELNLSLSLQFLAPGQPDPFGKPKSCDKHKNSVQLPWKRLPAPSSWRLLGCWGWCEDRQCELFVSSEHRNVPQVQRSQGRRVVLGGIMGWKRQRSALWGWVPRAKDAQLVLDFFFSPFFFFLRSEWIIAGGDKSENELKTRNCRGRSL